MEAKILKGVQKFTNVWVDITGLDPTRNLRNSWAITLKELQTHTSTAFFMPHITQTHLPWLQKRITGCWVSPKGLRPNQTLLALVLQILCVYFSLPMRIFFFLDLCPNRELGALKTLGSWPNTYQNFRSPSEKQKKEWDFHIFGSLTVLLFLIPSIVSCVLCCFVWSCLYESSLPWRDLGITCFNLYMWHCLDL